MKSAQRVATMTEHAKRSEAFAETFEAMLRGVFAGYRIVVTRPESSTQRGTRALLHVRLVRRDGIGMIIGCANTAEKTAKLGTLGRTLSLSKRRFGEELALDPGEYLHFLDIATRVLEEFGLAVSIVAFDREPDEFEIGTTSAPANGKVTYVAALIVSIGAFLATASVLVN